MSIIDARHNSSSRSSAPTTRTLFSQCTRTRVSLYVASPPLASFQPRLREPETFSDAQPRAGGKLRVKLSKEAGSHATKQARFAPPQSQTAHHKEFPGRAAWSLGRASPCRVKPPSHAAHAQEIPSRATCARGLSPHSLQWRNLISGSHESCQPSPTPRAAGQRLRSRPVRLPRLLHVLSESSGNAVQIRTRNISPPEGW